MLKPIDEKCSFAVKWSHFRFSPLSSGTAALGSRTLRVTGAYHLRINRPYESERTEMSMAPFPPQIRHLTLQNDQSLVLMVENNYFPDTSTQWLKLNSAWVEQGTKRSHLLQNKRGCHAIQTPGHSRFTCVRKNSARCLAHFLEFFIHKKMYFFII